MGSKVIHFTEWFNHFVSKTKPSADSPILLILDGHHTHTKNIEVIEIARENHVTIVSLPPHTTHKLQPLDRSFMGPLKHYYSENIRQWNLHSNRPFGPYDIAELLGNAFLKCQTGEVAAGGFSVTGIFPFNRHLFSDVDFAPSEEANVEDISLDALKASKGGTTHKKSTASNERSASTPSTAAVAPPTSRPATAARTRNLTLPAKDLAEAEPSGCSSLMPVVHVSPQDILPIPQPKKGMTNNGPKPMKCAVVTSLPYKLALEEAEKKRNEKLTEKEGAKKKKENAGKKSTSKNPKKKKSIKRKLDFPHSSDDERQEEDFDSEESVMEEEVGVLPPNDVDAVCMFCEMLYSEDTRGELWMQCLNCEMWAHNECAGADKDAYICDFYK